LESIDFSYTFRASTRENHILSYTFHQEVGVVDESIRVLYFYIYVYVYQYKCDTCEARGGARHVDGFEIAKSTCAHQKR
jgi:hypothetical protein